MKELYIKLHFKEHWVLMTYLHADFQYGFSQMFLIIKWYCYTLEYMLKINCSV